MLDCVNHCLALVMYLLNMVSPHDCLLCVPLALRKWYAGWTLSVYTSPPPLGKFATPIWKIRKWNAMTIVSLFNRWSVDMFLAFLSFMYLYYIYVCDCIWYMRERQRKICLIPSFFIYFPWLYKSYNEKEKSSILIFHIYRVLLSVCYRL